LGLCLRRRWERKDSWKANPKNKVINLSRGQSVLPSPGDWPAVGPHALARGLKLGRILGASSELLILRFAIVHPTSLFS
jgi:hypothetical protein